MKRAGVALSLSSAVALGLALAIAACSSDKPATSNPTTAPSPAASNDASAVVDAGAPTSDADVVADGAATGCAVAPVTVCPDSGIPTYTAEVAPIFESRCNGCHLGTDGGPWPLNDYDTIADWSGEVRATFLNCSMPPADSGVTISESETQTVLTWIKCGLPK